MNIHSKVTDPEAKCTVLTLAARRAQQGVIPIAYIGPYPPPQALADACPALVSKIGAGMRIEAANMAEDLPTLAHLLSAAGTLRTADVCNAVQSHLDDATTRRAPYQS